MGETLHQGQTTERNTDNATARTGYDDLSGSVSGFMQVLFPAVGGWNLFYTPKEGDQVVTTRLNNGSEEGYILGKVYTANKMPQGGAPNIFLMVSDDGKNVIRFDADNGTLDIVVDQKKTEKMNSLETEINENRKTDIGTDDDLTIKGNQTTEVKGNSKHKSADTDIVSASPIGVNGTNTELGSDVLEVFFDELIDAVTRNPILIPPAALPPGAPVPPAPPIINMHLKGVWGDIEKAAKKAKASCKKVLK